MKRVGMFDTKPYDRTWFDKLNEGRFDIKYFEHKLNADTARTAEGLDAAISFVNDSVDARAIATLCEGGVSLLALRCAGYNHVDFKAAYGRLSVVRVPGYSPNAVAEHAAALLLCLNRKLHKAYLRTREHNFTLTGLTGFDLYGKTAGVVGTGRIGRAMIGILRGLGMRVLAYDPMPAPGLEGATYTAFHELLAQSDVISLHCPLTPDTRHMLSAEAFACVKPGVTLINTSRGALIDSAALLAALKDGRVGAAGLDVYEEEGALFFEDLSGEVMSDDTLSLLIAMPNVLVTSHQGFLTREALESIARTTLQNIEDYFAGRPLGNEICYYCQQSGRSASCARTLKGRCF